MPKTLREVLGIASKSGPLPPKFLPKLKVRVGNDRNRQIAEINWDLPLEGFIDTPSLAALHEKFDDILRVVGILAPKIITVERENAEGNLQPGEEENG